MADVFKYIKQYCKSNNISKYALKSRVLTKDDFANAQSFAPGIAFFYRLSCSGIIENVANIGESFVEASTLNDFFDFSKIAEIKDYGTIQQATSDFIFSSDNMLWLKLHEGDNALFHTVHNIQLFYMYLSPIGEHSDERTIDVEITQQKNIIE